MIEEKRDAWNPRDPSILEDQREAYDKMREQCPVAHSKFMDWSLFRHEDIKTVLADPETFSNASRFLAIPNGMDPPVHALYHEALAGIFNQELMRQLEPQARRIAASLFELIATDKETEFISGFATPFALKVLCALLDWPDQQWERLSGWVHGNQQAAFSGDSDAGKNLAELFSGLVLANLDRRRAFPYEGADAMAMLLKTEIDGKGFTDAEIVSILRNWAAGHGTVATGLGVLALHLAENLALQDRLRSDLSLIPAAIEEILRVDDPLVANRRTTTREVEIAGQTIPKGESLTLVWIAANRDPRAFEDPNVVKLERDTADSLVWGQGIHICLGAPLARLEMRVALEELLLRTKHISLADVAPQRSVYPSNGLDRLHLRFS